MSKDFVCKKLGHYAAQCLNRKKKRGGTTTATEEAYFQTLFERECTFLICSTSVETAPNIRYIDNGASSHVTGVREHLIDLIDIEVRMDITLGYDSLVRVVVIGIVTFRRDGMPPISFRDVLYVPWLKKNLILVSTLQDRGLEVSFRGANLFIHPKGSSLASGQVIGVRDGKLFKLPFQPLHALALSNNNNRQTCEVWHHRMAHLHHGALVGLREVVTRVPQINTEHKDVYRGCALGKFTKASFPSSDTRSIGILDLVHTDVCGPLSWKSLSFCEYYLTFIDDYSRKT
jgi:hypothetical protein